VEQCRDCESPDHVWFYCGSNDINNAVSEEQIIANTSQCRRIIHDLSPATAFAYFSIIKAPQKKGNWELIDRLNAAMESNISAGDLYVETNTVFFTDSSPVARFFVEDGLHLTNDAYTALSAYVQPLISNWIRPGTK